MAEIPANEYLHRSIDQLRSMNERGILGSLGTLGHLTTNDLRNASLVHDYKPFNINELRQNVERLEYSNKLVERAATASINGHLQQQQQQQGQNLSVDVDDGLSNNQGDDLRHEHHLIQQSDMKQSYSAPPSPPSPMGEHMQDVKPFIQKSENQLYHRETKPYKCAQCTKTFANSSYLSQHTRIHLGIKPYRCEICQRKFTQLSHLQQHIRTHTGDKPYKCRHPGCQKAFSQLSNLQSHSRCHQTDKPYKCNSCYKCFTDEQTLLEHIPKHKESKHLKTHICNFCGKSYTQETYLQKHLQKHVEKAEKQSRSANANSQNSVLAAGLGLNLNRNLAMNVAAVAAAASASAGGSEHPYWSKMSPTSASVSLAEAIHQHNGYDFTLSHQQQQSELQSQHHRLVNNGNSSENTNDDVEDLRQHQQHIINADQHDDHPNSVVVVSSSGNGSGSYDVANIAKTVASSAFTPINTAPQLGGHHGVPQRGYLYDSLQFQTKNVNQSVANSFSNQLISLHQIRNYSHQPGAAAGLLSGEHLISVGLKEKSQ